MVSLSDSLVRKSLIFLDSKNEPLGSTEFVNRGVSHFSFDIHDTVAHSGDIAAPWYNSVTSIYFNSNKTNYIYADGLDLNMYDSDFLIYMSFYRKDSADDYQTLLHYYVDSANFMMISSKLTGCIGYVHLQLKVHGADVINVTMNNPCYTDYSAYVANIWYWLLIKRHGTDLVMGLGNCNSIYIGYMHHYEFPDYVIPIDTQSSRLVIGSGIDEQGNPTSGFYGALNTILISRQACSLGRLF